MPKVYLETFGCQMNELDSELVLGQLRSLGYGMTPDPDAADIVLYNTCSVREHAEQKVWSRLGQVKFRKACNPDIVVGVLGCMAERDGEDLIRRMPVVDVLCGPGELDKLPALLDNAVRTRSRMVEAGEESHRDHNGHPDPERLRSARQVALQGTTSRRSSTLAAAEDTLELLDLSRAVSPTEHSGSGYVRITRGCNKFCTYCVVPFTRGAEMHRPPDHIVDECKKLVDAGIIEVTLLGQTVNHYRFEHGAAVTAGGLTQPQKGRSYKGGHRRDPFSGTNVTTFADLLRRIHDEVPGIRRLRFVTSYPRDFGDDVLEVIRESPRICRYLHVPVQSGSNRILQLMNRGYTVEQYEEFLARARSFLHQPEIGRPLTVASDIIVGFPTETDDDFRATVELLRRSRFKNCFIFKYSPRPGTTAYDRIPDDVPDAVKRQRNNELLAVQQPLSLATSQACEGTTVDVFVEGLSVRQQKRDRRQGSAAADAGSTCGTSSVALTIGGTSVGSSTEPAHADSRPTVDADERMQLSGRTDGDLIVFFELPAGKAPDDVIGRIVPVRIEQARPLSMLGRLVETSCD